VVPPELEELEVDPPELEEDELDEELLELPHPFGFEQ
jgi:hypothetical protein